jgi:pilus assembly protein FimV
VVGVTKPIAVLRLVLLVALGLPLVAHTAGLGRLSVQSFLGQPLRAEIEVVSLLPGEESSLEARLATANAFAQAGIEFSPSLTGVRFEIVKVSGRPVLRVTTRQPVNDPFLDILIELRWATGLLVREYTILLDPPDYLPQQQAAAAPASAPRVEAPAQAAPMGLPAAPAPPGLPAAPAPAAPPAPAAEAPSAPAAAAPAAVAPAPTEAPAAPIAEAAKPEPRIEERPIAAAPAPSEPAVKPAPQEDTYEVKKGDTLGHIALRYRPEGVTFNQMLIALQRANEDAFIRNNVNLVRAGKILNIPDRDFIAAVDVEDANRLIAVQMGDFAEYRSSMAAAVAAAPAAPAPAVSAAAGQITPKPAEPKPAEAKDQLKLSRADAKKPGAAAAREDDLAARERALKEAQSRVADLEKNVSDLQKLMAIKNQQLAELEQKAGAKPAPAPATKAAEPPKPAPQAARAPEAKPAAPAPVPTAPEKPAAEAAKPAPAVTPPAAEAPKPAAEAPKPAVKPAPAKPRPVAPPPPEPSLVDEFLENPVALGGLGGVLLLLVGYGAWAWQRKKKSVDKFQDSVMGAASAPAAAAAAAAATTAVSGPASISQTSVSQSAMGGMATDDVDPIAEADVYMAYGRDAQAEEILKEALQKDANRIPVHAKLLEIYAGRRDARSFEQSALKLKGLTNGTGADWEKAAALGRSIDPGNGLYGGSAGQAAPVMPVVAPAAPAPAPSVDFDIGGQSVGSGAAAAAASALDLDLGGGSVPGPEKSDFSPGGTLIIDSQENKAASNGLDFDLGTTAPGQKVGADTTALNFELPGSAPASAQTAAPAGSAPASSGGLDFDLNLGGSGAAAGEATAAPAMDLSAISLDLGTPGEAPAAAPGGDPKWQEVATKLDLAKAYEEMGDKDGARELLNEVMREGDAAQQGQAKQMLAKLG